MRVGLRIFTRYRPGKHLCLVGDMSERKPVATETVSRVLRYWAPYRALWTSPLTARAKAIMTNERDDLCFCPLEGVMGVISKKWTLLIVNGIGTYGRLRFNRLVEEWHGINPKTLSNRLKELQTEGLIERESFAEIPPRVEYSLTKDVQNLENQLYLFWSGP